jgi:hypothetical protein
MNLARYTQQEANALEEYYIRGYKAEGLWGKGRPPANENRPAFNLTPAGIARQRKRESRKQSTYDMLKEGRTTVRAVCTLTGWSDTAVRLYFRQLESEGKAAMQSVNEVGQVTWRPL